MSAPTVIGQGGGPAVAGGYAHPSPSTAIVDAVLGGRDGRVVDLATSYEICRRINAAHGRTYYAATRLLPPDKRPHVHALYAFARYADDLVDHLDLAWTPAERRRALESWSDAFLADLRAGRSDDPVGKAVVHTMQVMAVDHADVEAFLRSMAMDLTVTRYETYDDLAVYVHGSAAVIGTMTLPVLEPLTPEARRPAMQLGIAFQLTNFIRDVAEDHARGRIYLPLEDLDRFGVTEAHLRSRQVGPELRRLLAFEIARTRALYRRAEDGWAMLPPASARCIRTAHRLYAGILDRVEASDYQVFRDRAVVPTWQKATVVAHELLRPAG
ncbi:phytoene/squalene synthase family protein [Euzebya sp.]|uniref:phytoene/squalene synthase family protein n=1 Tax=Euzebya sp. TaxID=1971409 RepID=UPI003518EA39